MLFFTLACFPTLEDKNFAPTLEIIQPENGAVYNEGENIAVELFIFDESLQNSAVSVQWISDKDGLISESVPNASGEVLVNHSELSAGEHNTSFVVKDSAFLTAQLPLLLYVNAAPSVPIVSIFPSEPATGESIQASTIGGLDPEGESVNTTFEWYRDNVLYEDVDPQQPETVPAGVTQKGETWSVRVVADDGAAYSEPVYAAVQIQGAIPEINAVNITAEAYNTSALLICEAEVSDADGDELDIEYTWQISTEGSLEGLEYSGSELQLAPTMLLPDELPYCTVQVTDSDGSAQGSAFVSLQNRAPAVDTLIIDPNSSVRPGMQVICDSEVSDPDLQELNTSYKWYRIDQNTSSQTLISLNQTLELTSENVSKGDSLECQLSVVDSLGLETIQSASVDISNTPPNLQSVGLVPTNPTGTDDIECSALATDIDGDAITYTYTWTVNGVLYPTPTDPSRFTEVLVAGDSVMCTVEVSDAENVGNSSSSTVTVINTPPEVTDVTLSPNPVFTNDLLTATVTAVDSDGDIPLIYYTWYVDGVEVKSGLGATLSGEDFFDKDQEILVVAYADDGIDQSFSAPSSPILVQNSPPTLPEVSVGGDYLSTDDDLYCQIITPSTDEDEDDIDYTTTWFLNGEPYFGGVEETNHPGDTILSPLTNTEETWECVVQASDETDITSEVTSATLLTACTVLNYYGFYNDLNDFSAIQDCWEIGRSNNLESAFIQSLSTYIPEDGWEAISHDYNDFADIPPDNESAFVTGLDYLGQSTPSDFNATSYEAVLSNSIQGGSVQEFFLGRRCVNVFAWSCQGRYLFLPDDTIAVHPGDQNVFMRWTAPLAGTCMVDLLGIGSEYIQEAGFGIAGYQTSTTMHLLHNNIAVNNIDIDTYSEAYPILEELVVEGGDIIDIVIEGDQSLSEWTGINGGISCTFDSTQ